MDAKTYLDIMTFIKEFKGSSRTCGINLKARFPQISPYTLGSILSTECIKKMMKNSGPVKQHSEKLYNCYLESVAAGDKPGIILRLAEDVDICPALLAKMLVEHYVEKTYSKDSLSLKTMVSKMIKDTTLIEDRDFAFEIYLCLLFDDQYGPYSDCIKQSFGVEYEMNLHRLLEDKGITFKTENQLRAKGYDKTPDVKLETPVAVDGFIINWIESKATFGDNYLHKQYTKEQFLSYWNRFGPGLVVYWLGFVETIIEPTEKRFIVREDVPTNIVLLNPTLIQIPSL